MNPQPITSERLLLRPARDEDLPALLALWRDPEVARYLFEGDAPTAAQAARYRDAFAGLWLVQRRADRALLGGLALRQAARGALEPRVALHPRHQGQGFAQEALAALMQAADALGAAHWVASCCVPDAAGDRLLQRAGFVASYECDGGRYRVRQYRLQRAPRRRAISSPIAACVVASSSGCTAG